MPLAVLICLSLQNDPSIISVERLTGEVRRPLLWTPLAVTLESEAGFQGDLEVVCGLGFVVRREIDVPSQGRLRILIPAIDPERVRAGETKQSIPRATAEAEWLVGVDARLPFASKLVSDAQVLYRSIRKDDLEPLLRDGLGEAFDLILLEKEADGGLVVKTRESAERAVADLLRSNPRPRVEVLDREIPKLSPSASWPDAKKDLTVFFVTLYALVGFATLAIVGRKHARFAMAAVTGVSALGVLAFFLFYPRGSLWVSENSCTWAPKEGPGVEWRIWFAGAAKDLSTEIEFPRLVKPVYPDHAASESSEFTLRALDRGCRVEGLRLTPGHPVCFTGVSSVQASRPPLEQAGIRRAGRHQILGTLGVDEGLPSEVETDAPEPVDLGFKAFRRFLGEDCVYGWSGAAPTPADVRSPDLDVVGEGRNFFVQDLE